MTRLVTLLSGLGPRLLPLAVSLFASGLGSGSAFCGVLEATGVDLLRRSEPALTGIGIPVAHPEAIYTLLGVDWEVNPAAVGKPGTFFTWSSDLGSSTNYPNFLGLESSHANTVGGLFYGAQGVAPAVEHVHAYEAEHYYSTYILSNAPLPARIVNQSFIFATDDQTALNQDYDDYAVRHQTLFVSGVGNGGAVAPPATAYNGLGIGTFDGSSSVGPTTDNRRCKPDLVAPGGFTSFSAPVVAGASALLLQAGLRGDGGAGSEVSASDTRVLRALLINGCIKPEGWSHSNNVPLDYRYGAGLLNVYNSYLQLRGGKHPASETTAATLGTVFQVGTASNAVSSLAGWDLSQLLSTAIQDQANHYLFKLAAEDVPRILDRKSVV